MGLLGKYQSRRRNILTRIPGFMFMALNIWCKTFDKINFEFCYTSKIYKFFFLSNYIYSDAFLLITL